MIITLKDGSKREVQESYPLTNTQEGIFIECTANMGSTIYNIPYLLKLDNKVDLDRLAEANVKNVSLSNFDAVAEVAEKEGYIKESDIARLLKFRSNPSDESWREM